MGIKRQLELDFGDLTESEVSELVDAAARGSGWTEQIEQEDGTVIDNPETQDDWVGRKLADVLGNWAETWAGNAAAKQARQQKIDEIRTKRDKVTHTIQ